MSLEPAESTPGQAVVPGRLLLDVVRSLPAEELSLEYRSAQQDVELVSGPARFHLRTLPPEDFPKLPREPQEGVMRVPTGAFVDTIARVARAASRDETRPHLTGVLVTASERELRMVATDSYRLSVKETQLETALDGSLEVNVPARTLQELARIAGAGEAETIGVAALENQVVFTVDDVMLSSRLVEGRFPNYQQLLPESYEHELQVSRDELLEVVRRVGLLAQKQRAAAAALLGGHARRLGPDAGRGRGERVAAGSVRRRTARDRLQSGVLSRRARERRDARSSASS